MKRSNGRLISTRASSRRGCNLPDPSSAGVVGSSGSSGSAAIAGSRRNRGPASIAAWLDREDVLGYLLIAPVVIIVIGLIGYPFVLALSMSLTDKVIGSPG